MALVVRGRNKYGVVQAGRNPSWAARGVASFAKRVDVLFLVAAQLYAPVARCDCRGYPGILPGSGEKFSTTCGIT